MRIDKIVVGQLEVNCYVISDGVTPNAMIVDPGDTRVFSGHGDETTLGLEAGSNPFLTGCGLGSK